MNPAFVLDSSMTLSWEFENEATSFTDEVLIRLKQSSALAPALWPFEVANVLATAERKGRLEPAQQAEFLEWLRKLPIAIEHRHASARTTSLDDRRGDEVALVEVLRIRY